MKKMAGYKSNDQLMHNLKLIGKKFKSAWMGKDFQPMPSYWALIPVKVEKNLDTKRK